MMVTNNLQHIIIIEKNNCCQCLYRELTCFVKAQETNRSQSLVRQPSFQLNRSMAPVEQSRLTVHLLKRSLMNEEYKKAKQRRRLHKKL